MAHCKANTQSLNIWFVDCGCSNHMTGTKSMFMELDETQRMKVELGKGQEVQVEGKGTVGIETSNGNVKLVHGVQFIPDLGYHLLSVGQLLVSEYSLLFDDYTCVIKHKQSGQILINIKMTPNKMFPLEVSSMRNFAPAAGGKDDSQLWNLRYGHLNINGLKLLSDKGMVFVLP
ncbi:hypothetical protein ABFS83_08G204000 [Erythranthe nasuta]